MMKKFLMKIWLAMLMVMALPAFAYDVSYTLNPKLSPAAMSEVMLGAKVTLSFDETVSILDGAKVTATSFTENDEGEKEYGNAVELPLYLDENGNVCFNFDVRGNGGDFFELKLPRGSVLNEDETKSNMVKTWTYILAPSYMVVKTINPGKEEVETLAKIITVNFTSQPESIAEGVKAELKNDLTGKTYYGEITIPEYMEKAVKIYFDYADDANDLDELCVPGTYTMNIPAGAITNKVGEQNAEITNTWKVSGTIDINDIKYLSASPEPGSTISSISTVTITFPATPILTKKPNSKIIIDNTDYAFTLIDNVLKAEVSPEITVAGTYTVSLPAGMVYALETGHGNEEITLTYTVESGAAIEKILFDGVETVIIYNCQGVCLNNNATIEDVRALQPGIYVINGKKIFIK